MLVIPSGENKRINPPSINQANNILLEILIRFRAITKFVNSGYYSILCRYQPESECSIVSFHNSRFSR